MRKISMVLALILVLTVAFVFSGCGQTQDKQAEKTVQPQKTEAKSDDTAKPEKKGFVIGWSPLFLGNSWQTQNWALLQEVAKNNPDVKEVVFANPDMNAENQANLVRNLIDKKVDAIIMQAVSPKALVPVVEEAIAQGIVVIMQDCMVDSDKVTSRVYVDDNEWSKKTGQWLVDKMGGKGKVVVLNGIAGNTTNQGRWGEAEKILKNTPGVEILAQANCDWEKAKAQSTVANWLNAYPVINGVWSQGGEMTAGTIDEFKKAKRPLVPMVGEAYNGFLKMWKENKSTGFSSIAPSLPCYNVQVSLELAVRALKKQPVPKTVVVPLPLVTDDNLDKYIKQDKPDDYWVFDKISQDEVNKMIDSSK